MSAEDPTEELEEILELARVGRMPRKAADWADDALSTAESILGTIDDMEAAGADARRPSVNRRHLSTSTKVHVVGCIESPEAGFRSRFE